MTQTISFVITNSGDGSNSVKWVLDSEVLAKMDQLAQDGDEQYASGDGLQVVDLMFPDDFDLKAWAQLNRICFKSIEDFC